ncbi:MAG: hypothetical protein IBX50_14470 [Marinospirillum sp.]|uniref:hypothetical protein n=1 Tax=Marinospirillum sp. TaxID=2183934 RepID=UPI0019F6838C|nr:hypothetical protein [Marinospirillum sp.]MBE0507893.1 hypothetical protein [Marinospirillum sp.]
MNTKVRFYQGLDYLLSHVDGFGVNKTQVSGENGATLVNICHIETEILLSFDDSICPAVWSYHVGDVSSEPKQFLTVQDLALFICNYHGLDFVFTGSVFEDVGAQLVDYPFKLVDEDSGVKTTRLVFSPSLQQYLLRRMPLRQRQRVLSYPHLSSFIRKRIERLNKIAASRPPVSSSNWRDHVYGKGASS